MNKLDTNRYLPPSFLKEWLEEQGYFSLFHEIGKSVEKRPIYGAELGKGKHKVLMWSQMHGNETTTTKALCDFLKYLDTNQGKKVIELCTFYIIPQLNPDGAKRYTRLNANLVDLNRDAIELTQPESIVLREIVTTFKPDYCFNLHGQRTIFSVGNSFIPATLSFLSPSAEENKSVTEARAVAMKLISKTVKKLSKKLPNAMGRYNDDFNINCVGDYFISQNIPTVLFEAGHYPTDYQRVKTRELLFNAMIEMIHAIANQNFEEEKIESYLIIPENEKILRDIQINSITILSEGERIEDAVLFLHYKEELKDGEVVFTPCFDSFNNSEYKGLKTIEANQFLEVSYFLDLDKNREENIRTLREILNF